MLGSGNAEEVPKAADPTSAPLFAQKPAPAPLLASFNPKDDKRNQIIAAEEAQNELRLNAVIATFQLIYNHHSKSCFQSSNKTSNNPQCKDWFGQGLSRIDALDATFLFRFRNEFFELQRWVESDLTFDWDVTVSTSAVSVRVLGALLSAFDLSNKPIFLEKAKQLADRLLTAFQDFPATHMNLKTLNSQQDRAMTLGHIASFALEFSYLSHHTNEQQYAQKALFLLKHLRQHVLLELPGVYGAKYDPKTMIFENPVFSLNSPSAPYYEVLFKLWALFTRRVRWVSDMWDEASNAIMTHLIIKANNFVFLREVNITQDYVKKLPKSDARHSFVPGFSTRTTPEACQLGGALGLFSQLSKNTDLNAQLFDIGEGLTDFCIEIYRKSKSGLASEEIVVKDATISENGRVSLSSKPLEAVMILSRVTGDPKYRKWAWEVLEALCHHLGIVLLKNTKNQVLEPKFSGIPSLDVSTFRDVVRMLKYLLLTFSDADYYPIQRYIFTADGHPLCIIKPDSTIYS